MVPEMSFLYFGNWIDDEHDFVIILVCSAADDF